jgi:undecaprenyl-diphosphatase
MNEAAAIILGIVEGVTEFLPISSTGHLTLAVELLGIEHTEFVKTFEIAIQLGAILSVVALYWRTLLVPKVFRTVVFAFLPTAVIGFSMYSLIKTHLLGNAAVVIGALFLGGIAMIFAERYLKKEDDESFTVSQISPMQAVVIGIFQSFAIVPGVSRAAATILGGRFLGISRRAIVEFSFLLAVPTMGAATAFDLLKSAPSFTGAEAAVLLIGFVVSFLTALFAVKFLLRYIRTHDFTAFGYYRIALAIVCGLILL